MKFSNLNRNEYRKALTSNDFDVLIIGGGITGAGIALDASLRGMKVALIEMQDFAAGTSSRSTKLVHGGLRYLKQFEVKLVAEVGKEREIVYENGPHVTKPEWMLLPIFKRGTYNRLSTSIGLRIYDFLAGVKKEERKKMLTIQETIDKEPLLKNKDLQGSGYYVEYRTDDARLTIEVIKAAVQNGAICVNYVKVEKLLYKGKDQVCGASVVDQLSGENFEVKAKKVVNATGPWVDKVREMDGSRKGKTLRLTKGVHIVMDQSCFPLKQSIYFDTPDGRMVFAIPRDGKTYVGTTDTFYKNDPQSPRMTIEDRNYLIQAIHYMFPSLKITEKEIESSWAGIRPLILEEGKDPSEISRKDEIWESGTGLLSIAGGKLTGYRKMAEMIVDVLVQKLHDEYNQFFSECKTKQFPISGGEVGGAKGFKEFMEDKAYRGEFVGITHEEALHLASFYGSNVSILFDMIEKENELSISSMLPIPLWAKLHYALEYEMVATPIDFFNRRTSTILFDIDSVRKFQADVIKYMEHYFQWSEKEKSVYSLQLESAIEEAIAPAVE